MFNLKDLALYNVGTILSSFLLLYKIAVKRVFVLFDKLFHFSSQIDKVRFLCLVICLSRFELNKLEENVHFKGFWPFTKLVLFLALIPYCTHLSSNVLWLIVKTFVIFHTNITSSSVR